MRNFRDNTIVVDKWVHMGSCVTVTIGYCRYFSVKRNEQKFFLKFIQLDPSYFISITHNKNLSRHYNIFTSYESSVGYRADKAIASIRF